MRRKSPTKLDTFTFDFRFNNETNDFYNIASPTPLDRSNNNREAIFSPSSLDTYYVRHLPSPTISFNPQERLFSPLVIETKRDDDQENLTSYPFYESGDDSEETVGNNPFIDTHNTGAENNYGLIAPYNARPKKTETTFTTPQENRTGKKRKRGSGPSSDELPRKRRMLQSKAEKIQTLLNSKVPLKEQWRRKHRKEENQNIVQRTRENQASNRSNYLSIFNSPKLQTRQNTSNEESLKVNRTLNF